MVDREEARRLAEHELVHGRLRPRIGRVLSAEELAGRLPSIYEVPDLTRCWIAYVERPDTSLVVIGPSTVILIDRETGAVVYVGSASDEG